MHTLPGARLSSHKRCGFPLCTNVSLLQERAPFPVLDVDNQEDIIISLSLSALYLKDIITLHGIGFQIHPQEKKLTAGTFLGSLHYRVPDTHTFLSHLLPPLRDPLPHAPNLCYTSLYWPNTSSLFLVLKLARLHWTHFSERR